MILGSKTADFLDFLDSPSGIFREIDESGQFRAQFGAAGFRSGSAGLAEWSSTLLQQRCWDGPGFEPRVRDLGTNPARGQGGQPEVDRGKFPLELAAAGAFLCKRRNPCIL